MLGFPRKNFSFFNFDPAKVKSNLKLPRLYQAKQFFKILQKKERRIFFSLFFLFLLSTVFLGTNFYVKNTKLEPAQGGTYVEGIIGQPRFINPIYASANDVDRDLTELIFSGLMKYDSEGRIVPDLADNCQIENGDNKVYSCTLRENVLWHDGFPFSADDVIFTVEISQNPDYNSSLMAPLFGVEAEKISNSKVRFKLKNPYAPFLETLTFKILPKHIWEKISSQNFPLAIYNFQPIGTGPFRYKGEEQDEKTGQYISFSLVRNFDYFRKKPYLSEILFLFFKNENDLIKAFRQGEIKGSSYVSYKNIESVAKRDVEIYSFSFPRYFDISFNPEKSKILAEKEVRQALNYGTNKKDILDEVLLGHGKTVDSPFMPEIYNITPPEKYPFDLEKAKSILEEAGWKDENGDGIREKAVKNKEEILFKRDLKKGGEGEDVKNLQACLAKDPQIYPEGEITGIFGDKTKEAVIKFQEKYSKDILEPGGLSKGTGVVSKTTREKLNEVCSEKSSSGILLKFSLATVDQEELGQVADLIKKQWNVLGADVEVQKIPFSSLKQNFLDPRNYESILFGKTMGLIPDPYPFWHSSQKRDPGKNIALYSNKDTDKILEEARQVLDETQRLEKYKDFQEILIKDAPAVFLYSSDYLYLVFEEIKGIKGGVIAEPPERFTNIQEWYIKTKRVWQ